VGEQAGGIVLVTVRVESRAAMSPSGSDSPDHSLHGRFVTESGERTACPHALCPHSTVRIRSRLPFRRRTCSEMKRCEWT
jgi:hypothetical protein